MEKVNLVVRKAVKKTIYPNDYVISYKALNARGPSSELEDELDFQEFINEYKKVSLAGKRMVLIVDVKNNVTKKRNSSNKHKKKVLLKVNSLLLKKLTYNVQREKNLVQFVRKIYRRKKENELKSFLFYVKCINVIYIRLHVLFKIIGICSLILPDYNFGLVK